MAQSIVFLTHRLCLLAKIGSPTPMIRERNTEGFSDLVEFSYTSFYQRQSDGKAIASRVIYTADG
jgi:hypothetical protein